MGKFDGVLICTDLDGTLYRKDKTISQENKEAIEYFKREGGYFTFITGRLPYYSTDAFKAVQPNVPFGCINGGGLYDGSAKEYVWKTELEREALTLVAHIENLYPSVGVQICGFDKTYFAIENETTVWFRGVTALPKILCNYRDFHEPMGKIIFCSNYEDIVLKVAKALSEHKLGERFDFVRSEKPSCLFYLLGGLAHNEIGLQCLGDLYGLHFLGREGKLFIAVFAGNGFDL